MPSEDEMRAVVQRYTERFSAGDADGVAALYTEDATIEDPIGTPLHAGREAIRAPCAADGRIRTMRAFWGAANVLPRSDRQEEESP